MRSVAAFLLVEFIIIGLIALLSPEPQPVNPPKPSVAWCEMDQLEDNDLQATWDFWMGPQRWYPCNKLPLQRNI